MGHEAQLVQALSDEVRQLKWRIVSLEHAEFECVRLVGALRASEDRYRSLLEGAGFPITISTVEGAEVLYANPPACRLFGFEGPVPAGRRMTEFYLGALDREGLVGRLRAEGVVRDWEVILRDGLGQPRIALVTASLVTYEGQEAVLATSNDITERKHAEALFRTLVETSPDAITMVDLLGEVTYASPRTLQLLGYDRFEEIRGRQLMSLVAPGDHGRVEERLLKILGGVHSGALEVQGLKKDGGSIAHESNAEVLRNPDGSPDGFFFITRDLTARKRAERALRLAEKLEGLGLMAAGIAHDLNNAFQLVRGQLEVAQSLHREDAELGRILVSAQEGVDRAAALARNMLDYSGTAQRTPTPCDLRLLAQEGLDLWRGVLSSEVVLALEAGEGLPRVTGDEGQLAKVVTALVLNGVEALEGRPGRVDLALEVVELVEEDLALGVWPLPVRCGPCLRLEVRDQGCGIPPDHLERVADPFFTTKGLGRGLGLSVALGILRGHRAGLQFLSDPGAGTSVRACFPLEETGSAAGDLPGALPPAAPGILLAEDEASIRELIAGRLRAWGYGPVFEAGNGEEALDLFRAHGAEIGLLLTDATMPKMTGPQLLAALRALRPELPAILVTGYASEQVRPAAPAFGFSAFIQKPFRFAELRGVLEGLMPSPGRRG